MGLNASRIAFEKRVKEIHYVADELRSQNPRFNLDWNEKEGRYKYMFIDTLFKIFEPMYLQLVESGKEPIIKQLDPFTETESTKSTLAVEKLFDADVLRNMYRAGDFKEVGDLKVIKLYPLQAVYMDRWSAPEEGETMYFYSNRERADFLRYHRENVNNKRSVPDEYTTFNIIDPEEVEVSKLKNCTLVTQTVAFNYCKVLKSNTP